MCIRDSPVIAKRGERNWFALRQGLYRGARLRFAPRYQHAFVNHRGILRAHPRFIISEGDEVNARARAQVPQDVVAADPVTAIRRKGRAVRQKQDFHLNPARG